MSATSLIRDVWTRGSEMVDIHALADQRILAAERPHGEYRITVTGNGGRKPEASEQATLEEFSARLAEVRSSLRDGGWSLESSADEWPGA